MRILLRSDSPDLGLSVSKKTVLASLVVALSWSCNLRAQTTISGGLEGIITDQTGAVVPDVDVKIKDLAKGVVQSTTSENRAIADSFFFHLESML